MTVTLVDHPIIAAAVTRLREASTPPAAFRALMRRVGFSLAYEATRNVARTTRRIMTPLEEGEFAHVADEALCFASILRAGNGLLDGALDFAPEAAVAHIGLYRDHATLEAVEYVFRAPADLADRLAVVLDPMLATGHTAAAAIQRLKGAGANRIVFACLVAAPEGIAALSAAHGDTPIFAAALDRGLNDKGYILPGLGDAGDRLYGTT